MEKSNVKTLLKLIKVLGLIFAIILVAKGTIFS